MSNLQSLTAPDLDNALFVPPALDGHDGTGQYPSSAAIQK